MAKEYLATQEARAKRGEISKERPKKLKAVLGGALENYVGSVQVHRIGDELWASYPAWRRENGAGRNARNGMRDISAEEAAVLDARDAAGRARAMAKRGFTKLRPVEPTPAKARTVANISDSKSVGDYFERIREATRAYRLQAAEAVGRRILTREPGDHASARLPVA